MSELALVEGKAVSTRNEEQLVTMTVDGQLFGLPILSVQDIVETHKITQVPRTPSAISGIMNLRGRIVTVINLRRILGRSDDSDSRMGVTVEFKGDLYTILVDQIGEVRLLNRSDFESAPATLDAKLKQLCMGIYRLDGELLAVLDVNQILSPETIAQTPPIQFIARRQKEAAERPAAPAKALAAPAPETSVSEPEEVAPVPQAPVSESGGAAPAPGKYGKNLFRKIKASAAAAAASTASPDPAARQTAGAKSASRPSSEGASAKSSAPTKVLAAPADPQAPAALARTTEAPADRATASPSPYPPHPAAPDLLEPIGGETALAAIVAAFYDKVASDKRLAGKFGTFDTARQCRAMQVFLTAVLKGNGAKPIAAPGHQWLAPKKGLNDDDFNRCLGHFEAALHARLLPEAAVSRILALLERYRESVVD